MCVYLFKKINIELRFKHKHADAELEALLEGSVPPCDISRICVFRTSLEKYDKEARSRANIGYCGTRQAAASQAQKDEELLGDQAICMH